MWFEPDLLPGYAWSFPLPDGRANVGFGIQRGGKVGRVQDMGAIWPELLARPHVRDGARRRRHARGAPPGVAHPRPRRRRRAHRRGRTLFVGDAATATDPMTGEGIGQALLTGVLAAEADRRRAGPTPPAVDRRLPTAAVRARSSPTTACRCCSIRAARATARASASRCGSPAPPAGPAATSPAGCSRTTPGRWWSRPAAGAGACSPAPAPTAAPAAAILTRPVKRPSASRPCCAPA